MTKRAKVFVGLVMYRPSTVGGTEQRWRLPWKVSTCCRPSGVFEESVRRLKLSFRCLMCAVLPMLYAGLLSRDNLFETLKAKPKFKRKQMHFV